MAGESSALRHDLLEVLGYLRVDPELPLEPVFKSKVAGTEALAIRLARILPARLDLLAVEMGFVSARADVRAAALETGMVLGRPGAFEACKTTVATKGPAFRTAALLLGLSGDEGSVAGLLPALGDAELARDAAFALGFSGRVTAADALLAVMMEDEETAPVAAEGFAAITGLTVEKDFALSPKVWNPDEEEQDEEGEKYGPEADLLKPEPNAIASWWANGKPKLDPAKRWMRGRPWSGDRLLHELDHGPARRREALALDLAIRSQGKAIFTWDALTERQRAEMGQIRQAHTYLSVKPFGVA